jgi:hypothetical protein
VLCLQPSGDFSDVKDIPVHLKDSDTLEDGVVHDACVLSHTVQEPCPPEDVLVSGVLKSELFGHCQQAIQMVVDATPSDMRVERLYKGQKGNDRSAGQQVSKSTGSGHLPGPLGRSIHPASLQRGLTMCANDRCHPHHVEFGGKDNFRISFGYAEGRLAGQQVNWSTGRQVGRSTGRLALATCQAATAACTNHRCLRHTCKCEATNSILNQFEILYVVLCAVRKGLASGCYASTLHNLQRRLLLFSAALKCFCMHNKI